MPTNTFKGSDAVAMRFRMIRREPFRKASGVQHDLSRTGPVPEMESGHDSRHCDGNQRRPGLRVLAAEVGRYLANTIFN
jgi:hypothetical protein